MILNDRQAETVTLKDPRLFKLWQQSKLDIEDFIDREWRLITEIAKERKENAQHLRREQVQRG